MKYCYDLSNDLIHAFKPFPIDNNSKHCFFSSDDKEHFKLVEHQGFLSVTCLNTSPEVSLVNSEFDFIIRQTGCYIGEIHIFVTRAGAQYSPHIDCESKVSTAKINYILGGKDSYMNWFSIKSGATYKMMIDTPTWNFEDCEEIYRHSTHDKHAYLLENAVPHSMTNPLETRTCYSMFLFDLATQNQVSFEEAKSRLQQYILQ